MFAKARMLVAMLGGEDLTGGIEIKWNTGEETDVPDC
jgi:hypothetical protein